MREQSIDDDVIAKLEVIDRGSRGWGEDSVEHQVIDIVDGPEVSVADFDGPCGVRRGLRTHRDVIGNVAPHVLHSSRLLDRYGGQRSIDGDRKPIEGQLYLAHHSVRLLRQ